jgi:dihydropyrimidine dehydrogenase (NAD+) subunit PreT
VIGQPEARRPAGILGGLSRSVSLVMAWNQEWPELKRLFPEIHPPFELQEALLEANRCLYCFDAPCTAACPTHIDVPRFIKKIAQGNLRGSALTILNANILGASCSRVCPVDVLCEGACVYHRYNKQPIQIGRLQRHATEHFLSNGAALLKRAVTERQEKIACIGAGPASLACAAELRLRGFPVTVFEARALPGGLNTHGVAEYKLRPADSLREIEMIGSLGVEFRFSHEINGESALADLEKEFSILFIGSGLGAMHKLNIRGEDLPGVVNALEFIEGYKTKGDLTVGRRVAVVGAGNTAIDAARASVRLGAEEVHLVYRRGEQQMSAFSFEYEQAKQEGVRFDWWTLPVAIRSSDVGGKVSGLECVRVELTNGSLNQIPGSAYALPCDMVIPAIGQSSLLEFLKACRGIDLENGRVRVDRETGRTSNPRYFAGGDCVNGGREVVDAVAEGKRAAVAMARSLEVSHA